MVIQRLARSSEPWTVDTLRGTVFSLLLLSLSLFLWLYLCIRVSMILVRAYVSSSPSLRPSFSLPTFFPPTFLSSHLPSFLLSSYLSFFPPSFLHSSYLPLIMTSAHSNLCINVSLQRSYQMQTIDCFIITTFPSLQPRKGSHSYN